MFRARLLWAVLGSLSISAIWLMEYAPASAAEGPAPAETPAAAPVTPLTWHHDYREARDAAIADKRLLLIWFADETQTAANEKFQREVLDSAAVRPALAALTLAKVSTQTVIERDGEQLALLKHHAFADLAGGPGLAMVDTRDDKEKHYGWVVTIYPFRRGSSATAGFISASKLKVLCELPAGTLTQRTLMYAVRTHPSAPQSAWSPHNKYLAAEAEKHSQHQANILLQGHHNWDARFHQINAALGAGGAKEVCAESWVGQSLVDAAEECVHSWSQSSGHWAAVSARHSFFGYDMKRGTNGVWYATGIFGGR